MHTVKNGEKNNIEQFIEKSKLQNIVSAFVGFFKTIIRFLAIPFKKFDEKLDGGLTFFLKHYGKSRFMVAMSKKVQYLGIEKLFLKGPKAFVYFFLFYLIRDTILYIILPIYFASLTSN